MQYQRTMMRARVATKFGRIPAQHGDGNVPAFYPMPIGTYHSLWGSPFGKVKEGYMHSIIAVGVLMPIGMWLMWDKWMKYKRRQSGLSRTAGWPNAIKYIATPWWDMDDPDLEIRAEKFEEEKRNGELDTHWGGTNFLASYLWMPGQPEPDTRRKDPPAGGHHH